MTQIARLSTAALLATAILAGAEATPVPPVDFNAHVRPVLSANCFACHGADESSRKAGLRLDVRAAAMLPIEGRTAIHPGQPDASELVRRVTSSDPALLMPPPKHGHALKPAEVDLLRRWIAAGAEYAEHWAFVKPTRPEPPPVAKPDWPRNPVDQFILARLDSAGLSPAPPADPRTLARRLALDLTGLPPTPAEVETFVAAHQRDPQAAISDYVDRQFASPHYGEHWARPWLDLARYADSAGYGSDPLRLNIWPYRDWLIAALNRNQPFDQFTLEQIAGDLLPGATEEQRIATAFHRNTMTNTEGGTDDEEWRVAAVKDRINVTLQAWMGLTMSCASCHTHKFDPISHQEYYRMFALFNQTEDNDQPDERPTQPFLAAAEQARRAELTNEIARLEVALKQPDPTRKQELETQPGPPIEAFHVEQRRRELAAVKPTPLPVMRELPPAKQRKPACSTKATTSIPARWSRPDCSPPSTNSPTTHPPTALGSPSGWSVPRTRSLPVSS
jgi:hypothetical protein